MVEGRVTEQRESNMRERIFSLPGVVLSEQQRAVLRASLCSRARKSLMGVFRITCARAHVELLFSCFLKLREEFIIIFRKIGVLGKNVLIIVCVYY